jgi:hypothetical protein
MYNLNLLVDTLLPLRLIEGIPTIVPYGSYIGIPAGEGGEGGSDPESGRERRGTRLNNRKPYQKIRISS